MAAVKLLEKGVEDLGPDTQAGGDAQLWLALSYQVCMIAPFSAWLRILFTYIFTGGGYPGRHPKFSFHPLLGASGVWTGTGCHKCMQVSRRQPSHTESQEESVRPAVYPRGPKAGAKRGRGAQDTHHSIRYLEERVSLNLCFSWHCAFLDLYDNKLFLSASFSRKPSVQSRLPKRKVKASSSYWDRADWSMGPTPSILPDKWYVRVAAAAIAVVFVVFLNMQAHTLQ